MNEKIIKQARLKISAGQSGGDDTKEIREKRIRFTVSPGEFLLLQTLYKKSSYTTLAKYCREKALSENGLARININDGIAQHAQEIVQLNKIGQNINQIARKLNSGEPAYGIMLALESEVKELRTLKWRYIEEKLQRKRK